MISRSIADLRDRTAGSIRSLLWRIAPAAFDALVRPYTGQRFSIGIYSGSSLIKLTPAETASNPVLNHSDVDDAPAAFVADPFMIRRDGTWHMLFEIMNHARRRGQIGWALSEDGLNWQYQKTVLTEPFHLAYPHIFEFDGDIYLIPDSPGHGIRLYRARRFPDRWEFVRELRSDNTYSDATIFQTGDLWWMFVAWAPEPQRAKSLRLFFSDNPTSDWHEHPQSPVVEQDDRISRPAGRVVACNGRHVRLTQECEPIYGLRVHGFEVVELTRERYAERAVCESPILQQGPASWQNCGMHHADVHQCDSGGVIACVDGWQFIENGQPQRDGRRT